MTQIEDDHKPEVVIKQEPMPPPYSNQNNNDQARRPPRKRSRFDEPLVIPMDSNTNPTNIPSLLNLSVEPPPDIQIDLSDLRSDDEDDRMNSMDNGNGDEENWDHY